MDAKAWFIIAIVGFSLAGIAVIAAIFMFIKMNIPAIIGDVTGKTVAREIKAMREVNASGGDKRFRPGKVNMNRGVLDEKAAQAPFDVNTLKKAHALKRFDIAADKLNSDYAKKKGGTVGLADVCCLGNNIGGMQTELLNSAVTEVLSDSVTEVLSEGTAVLTKTKERKESNTISVPFKVIKSVIVIHSDEVI